VGEPEGARLSCDFAESGMGFGSHAEYICVPAQGTMAAKPKSENSRPSSTDATAMTR